VKMWKPDVTKGAAEVRGGEATGRAKHKQPEESLSTADGVESPFLSPSPSS
jgi:hypothetical protein